MKKLFAFLLCAAMLLSLAACTQTPVDTTPPTESTSNRELALELYAQARKALDDAANLTLDLEIVTTTEVAGSTFSRRQEQTLTYQDRGTDYAVIALEDKVAYGVHLAEDADTSDYSEIWYQDTLYVELLDSYRFSGNVTAEEAAARYIPAVLMDAALYGSVTTEATIGGTKVFFSQPTAAESWAMPEDAELESAFGTVLLNSDGAISKMDYTVTYTYGSTTVTTQVQSKPAATAKTVSAPEKAELYPALTDVDAVWLMQDAIMNSSLSESITFSNASSLMSQAAAIVQNDSCQMHTYSTGSDLKLKLENTTYFMNYGTGQSEETELTQTYIDGKLTTERGGALPSTSTLDWETITEFYLGQLLDEIPAMDYWQDATVTDLGTVYLVEMVLNENFGNTMQNYICYNLWQDASFLLNLSDAYKNGDLNGYLSVDKYTGTVVAAGYYYEGTHTIEGTDYLLTMQYDQSVEAPALGAYKEITGEMLPEEEPEDKATPLFYHVTGADGQEMWLFGTIHVGNERTAYLPQEIKDAFAVSDALALEFDSERFDEMLEEDEELAATVSGLYFFSDGTTVESLMEEEDYTYALQLLKAVGGNNMNMPYAKPYAWSNTIEMFYLRQGYQLHRDQGVEERLTAWAKELNKPIRDVESGLFQTQMTTGWSNELQMMLLEGTLTGDGVAYWQDTWELYELWCAGDEAAMREALSESWDTSEMTEEELAKYTPLMEEYDKSMSYDRNEGMLDVAIEYLESGDVVFYAVGLAHLLDNTNGLVDALRDAGYTVELVTYN